MAVRTEFPEHTIHGLQMVGEIIDVGAAAAKAMPPGRRYRYKRKLVYLLDDDQRVDGEATGMTKPKLEAEILARLRHIGRRCMFAKQYVGHDDGQLKWYTITRMTIKVGKPMQEVVCDGCNKDYTNSSQSGGIQFETKAFGPCCQESVERSAEQYKEEHFIKARCPEGKSFADWVREDLR